MAIKKPLVNYGGRIKELTSGDSISGASSNITEVEIDFGSIPTTSKKFTITDAGVTISNKVLVYESGNPATNRGSDDYLWDSISFAASAGTGSFTLYAKASGRIKGKRNILYTIN